MPHPGSPAAYRGHAEALHRPTAQRTSSCTRSDSPALPADLLCSQSSSRRTDVDVLSLYRPLALLSLRGEGHPALRPRLPSCARRSCLGGPIAKFSPPTQASLPVGFARPANKLTTRTALPQVHPAAPPCYYRCCVRRATLPPRRRTLCGERPCPSQKCTTTSEPEECW
ncbi:hypothetical protein OH77DRAFT_1416263 [Trametes cingulata]|nr:hypothetical protein OH77DRAFT_1416263 [Trametes cingulata]